MNTLLPILNSPEPRQTAECATSDTHSLQLDRRTYDRALACTHCGLCLPKCPTYLETGHEAEGPRGRIQLIRGLSDGEIQPTRKIRQHLDSCLDCRSCESACPAGVVFHDLIEETRDNLNRYDAEHPPAFETKKPALDWFIRNVVAHPTRLKLAALPVRLLQRTGAYAMIKRLKVMKLLPAPLAKLEKMLPEEGPLWPRPLPGLSGTSGMDAVLSALQTTAIIGTSRPGSVAKTTRKTVGFFAGCVGSILNDNINRMAIEVIAACNCEVYAPRQQSCCGGIHKQTGAIEEARDLARKNIDLFLPPDRVPVDYIVSTISGCNATMREYDRLLRDDIPYAGVSLEFQRRSRDLMQLLAELTLPEFTYELNLTVAFQDACQSVPGLRPGQTPREVLSKIPGLQVVDMPEYDICCGAAGSYAISQPEIASSLAQRKLNHLAACGAQVLVISNPGCAAHLTGEARERGQILRIMHPIELIHYALFGPKAATAADSSNAD
jgi:glycolate oxidase iron-sulfur subunit